MTQKGVMLLVMVTSNKQSFEHPAETAISWAVGYYESPIYHVVVLV